MGLARGRRYRRLRCSPLISRFRLLWLLAGLTFLAIGAVGVILPLLPTTPFLLLAAYCFTRSSPRMHRWLHGHATFGPLISNWNQYGSIDRRSKRIALIVILLTPTVTLLVGIPWWALVSQLLVLGAAAAFVLTRPDPPRDN
jgi:uncharacterized membrane protein YbaN (DUF454 family)